MSLEPTPVPVPDLAPAPVIALSLTTVADTEAGRRLFGLHDLADKPVVKAMEHLRKQQTGGDSVQPIYLQRIVVASLIWGQDNTEQVVVAQADEAELLQTLFSLMDSLMESSPAMANAVMVCRGTYDSVLPLLRLRAMRHDLVLPACWRDSSNAGHYDLNHLLGVSQTAELGLMGQALLGSVKQGDGDTETMECVGESQWVHDVWLAGDYERLAAVNRQRTATLFDLFCRYRSSCQV